MFIDAMGRLTVIVGWRENEAFGRRLTSTLTAQICNPFMVAQVCRFGVSDV
jgi:hypothetical protein